VTSAAGRGTLYLLPSPVGGGAIDTVLPEDVLRRMRTLAHFIVETPKQARRWLRQAGVAVPLQDLHIAVLDEHSRSDDLPALLAPLLQGHDVGMISDAGCPAVADPGAALVRAAHESGVRVVPLVGPSSILLALMASGLNGQRFAFHGYLPVDASARTQRIRELERASRDGDATQVFIETPYRNLRMFEALIATCEPATRLCIACDLTLASERVTMKTVSAWRRAAPDIDRRPAVFLLYAGR
jgi:16S rRNA (cytidine1402-2'-O)-methyltransferase